MLHIALYEPEIPPNTGNIIRLCANSGAQLQVIHPLGFELTDKHCRRAGLDYKEYASIVEHENYAAFKEYNKQRRIIICETVATQAHSDIVVQDDDVFLFGPETRGLPQEVMADYPSEQMIRIPMLPHSRSLNLSNSCAVVLYEAWRQLGYLGS